MTTHPFLIPNIFQSTAVQVQGNGQFKVRQRRRLLKFSSIRDGFDCIHIISSCNFLKKKKEEIERERERGREAIRRNGKVRISFPSFLFFSCRRFLFVSE